MHCGKPEDEHHAFEAVVVPDSCQCDYGTWDKKLVGPICDSFVGTQFGYCARCEHDESCHAKR